MLAVTLFMSSKAQAQQTFDYYLLNLSWSPQYCATDPNPDQLQCGPDKHFGFVVHGLWPQRQNGGWPQDCSAEVVPDQQINSMLDIMPSRKLVKHEWKTHGSCSGLGVNGYFQAVRQSFTALTIPERYRNPQKAFVVQKKDFIAEFLAANPGLKENMIALNCTKSSIKEVGICLDKDAKTPRACGSLNFQCKTSELRFTAKR
jgi:ribonuclease T2